MPRAVVNGIGIHYETDGDGKRCFVLHGGLGVDHTLYRRTLAPMTEQFRLVFFDHRANGRSVPADLDSVTMEQLADDVVGLADQLAIDRFVVWGHSYGGFVAQEVALRHPDRVDGLILADTSAGQLGSDESAGEDQGPPPPPELQALLSTMPVSDEHLGELMVEMLRFYLHKGDPAEAAHLFDQTIHRLDAMIRGFEVLAGWSSVDRLHDVAAPTLLLVGRHDLFTSFPQSYRIARRIPHAEVVVLDGCGHFPWIEEPDSFFGAMRDWVGRKLSSG